MLHQAEQESLLPQESKPDQDKLKAALEGITYPVGTRTGGIFFKALWGTLLGAGTVLSIMAVVASLHWLVITAIGVGAVVWTGAAISEIVQNNKKEWLLTKKLNEQIDDAVTFLEKIDYARLNTLIAELDTPNSLTGEEYDNQVEHLYAILFQIKKTYAFVKPLIEAKLQKEPNQRNQGKFSEIINKFKTVENQLTELNNRRGDNKDTPPKENLLVKITPKPNPPENESRNVVISGALKVFNRALSFAGGASTGTTIAVGVIGAVSGVVAIGALLSNPVGWAILGGIVASAILVGAIALTIDYGVNRPQQKKIAWLEKVNNKIQGEAEVCRGVNKDIEILISKEEQRKRHAAEMQRTYQQLETLRNQEEQRLRANDELKKRELELQQQLEQAKKLAEENAKRAREKEEENRRLHEENSKLKEQLPKSENPSLTQGPQLQAPSLTVNIKGPDVAAKAREEDIQKAKEEAAVEHKRAEAEHQKAEELEKLVEKEHKKAEEAQKIAEVEHNKVKLKDKEIQKLNAKIINLEEQLQSPTNTPHSIFSPGNTANSQTSTTNNALPQAVNVQEQPEKAPEILRPLSPSPAGKNDGKK